MIEIDEWQAAQENIEAVSVCVTWRCVDHDPVLAALIAGLPPENYFIPIRLADGRTELAVDHPDPRLSWKHLRFGKGPPIFELAKHNYEAWAGEGLGSRLARDRKQLTDMIRRHVPKFDDYTDKEQVDFIIRTQKKVNAVRRSVKGLVNHLEYASPDRYKAVPPLKDETEKVRAAVFSELMDSRRAGELLAVRHNDKTRYENQRVRKMAKLGRRLLCGYYGAAEYGAKINRMQRFYKFWRLPDGHSDGDGSQGGQGGQDGQDGHLGHLVTETAVEEVDAETKEKVSGIEIEEDVSVADDDQGGQISEVGHLEFGHLKSPANEHILS